MDTTDDDEVVDRKEGYPRYRGGSYHAAAAARRPPTTIVHGTVGTVDGLHEIIDDRLRELDWSWSTLAAQYPCSRQYIHAIAKNSRVAHKTLVRIFEILEMPLKGIIKED
jgi:hypothetical protein